MKHQYHFLIILLVLTTISCNRTKNTVTPIKKDITQAVYASGKIYPVNDYKVFTKLPGYVETIHVKVAEEIKIGQALITIKSEISELNVAAAKNAFELAQKNATESAPFLTSLKANVASAKSKYELDSLTYSRLKNLLKENATSKNQYDQAEALFEISKQTYLTALNNYKNTRERAQTEFDNARIQYEAQISNKKDYTIVSVMEGKIYDILPKEGELINTQNPVMEIGEKNNYEVELSVDETDVSFVQQNQAVVYTIDAYKNQFFKGKILEAYPRISQSNKTSKIIASIEIDESLKVFSGMSVEANIIISERKNVLVIPREFLIENNKVKIKASEELIEIKKGAEDLEFIEVLSGIDENTEIVKQ